MLFPCILLPCWIVTVVGTSRLEKALNALDRGLSFMEERIEDINLDAVLGIRLVEEQLTAFQEFEPREMNKIGGRLVELRDKARTIANEAAQLVRKNDPDYSSSIGRVMDPSKRLLWQSSRPTDRSLIQAPVPCALSAFNETDSDHCLQQILGKGSELPCQMSERCLETMSSPRQQGYILTHQVLYWQMLQMHDCVRDVSDALKVSLCSNVLRDAEKIADARFPRTHRDLFMEQIGLCGMWGFRDFYRTTWFDTILSWQQPSGCYNDRAKWYCIDDLKPDVPERMKRREKILKGGCLSHKTAVALLAITASIRFEAEKEFQSSN
ncbi:UPF0764 protein C16orf89 like protein [Argiope bruennichi]|uniref:UPF0764 protein C16orf89 like protein n=1 Tax=Argiope bruennichi TaxID=94029 RepID=A0A8T0EBJ3_ARGBR|nr:UPF0764 protein C16orf89 like protein [Argiope bruennichi]